MKSKLLALLLSILFLQCGINKQRNGVKVGKWVYKQTFDGIVCKSKGRYDKNGNEKGVWKQYFNGKLYKKEVYKGVVCTTTFYYPNGKIKEMGLTRTDETEQYITWYYTGDWFYFDENENLTEVRVFEKGLQIEQLKIN
ncbi:hypothetical protein LZZ90_00795 [Flavobacterium sp. SM15]|uniref:hypothetical protein n=1 Tax=Flavobacterium sp. SM15 TaxID=2908005 RepID=UPI001EDC3C41|nr:hypothetical protein [Flavobacterium sp. SM15]MCG2610039.1 hypothetical protein [Flavobacterium sp. SM15]